jgi:hypothetical protein
MVRGVTVADAVDRAPVPTMFVAETANVYATPFVKPETSQVNAPSVLQSVKPAGPARATV